jgi:Zn-dependent protease with chaperone function
MQEDQVALLLAHELSHFLLDHQFYRLVKALFVNKIASKLIKTAGFKEVYDPTKEEFKLKVADKQLYSCFYP